MDTIIAEDNLKAYWFCPQCRGILRPIKGLNGGGKFVVNRKNPEVGIKGAINIKRLPADAYTRALMLANDYFSKTQLNQVAEIVVRCPQCALETVTLTLSYKFDEFTTQTQSLNYDQQIQLFRQIANIGNFCSACGTLIQHDTAKFCLNCGTSLLH